MSSGTRVGPRHASPESAPLLKLVGLELRRLWWRRLTRYGLVAVLVAIAFSLYGTWRSTQPPSPAERIQQEQAYQQALQGYPNQQSECRSVEASARSSGQTDANFNCDHLPKPSPEMFGPTPATFGGLMPAAVEGTATVASFVLFLIGASFIAAEFNTGSMGTWLTFEPRRLRVGTSKLAAGGLGALLAALLLFASTALGVWVVCLLNGTDSSPPALPSSSSVAWSVVRGVVMVTAAGIAGASIALMVRSTAAVIGIVVGYAIVFEGVISSTWPTLQQWVIQLNLRAWLLDGTTYTVVECTNGGTREYACSQIEHTLPLSQAWVYLVVLGAIVIAGALWMFRRRDVG